LRIPDISGQDLLCDKSIFEKSHLTLDSWRPFQADDSWKMTLKKINEAFKDKGMDGIDHSHGSGTAPL
jgi:hypothetical protein